MFPGPFAELEAHNKNNGLLVPTILGLYRLDLLLIKPTRPQTQTPAPSIARAVRIHLVTSHELHGIPYTKFPYTRLQLAIRRPTLARLHTPLS